MTKTKNVQYIVTDSNKRSMFGVTSGNGLSVQAAYQKALDYWTGAPSGSRLWRSTNSNIVELFPAFNA